MRVVDVTPSCDLAAKCHLKREREVYKHVLTLALLEKTFAGKKTKSRGSKMKALFLVKGERVHPMCGLFVKMFPFLRSPSFSVVAARTCVLLLWTWKWNDLSVGGAFSFSQVYFLHCDLFAPSRCRRLIKCICLSHLAKCLLKTDDPWCSSIPCYLLFTTHTLCVGSVDNQLLKSKLGSNFYFNIPVPAKKMFLSIICLSWNARCFTSYQIVARFSL